MPEVWNDRGGGAIFNGCLVYVLGVSADYLLEGDTEDAARADFQDRELLRPFQEVEKLPDADKDVVKKLLEAFPQKESTSRRSFPGSRLAAGKQSSAEGP